MQIFHIFQASPTKKKKTSLSLWISTPDYKSTFVCLTQSKDHEINVKTIFFYSKYVIRKSLKVVLSLSEKFN